MIDRFETGDPWEELDIPEDDESEDGDPEAELTNDAWVSCPYCGESVQLFLDPAGGARQEYVEDCEVCCQPWAVTVTLGPDGVPFVSVTTLDAE